MGIKFLCHHCENPMHVKDFLAGKRGKCPQCGGSIRIPANGEDYSLPIAADAKATESLMEQVASVQTAPQTVAATVPLKDAPTKAATAEPQATPVPAPSSKSTAAIPEVISEAPNAAWYVRPPSGGQYGPAIGTVFWDWLNEKRVGENSLVWREGWGTWQTAKDVFPDFFRALNSSSLPKAVQPPPEPAPVASAPITSNPEPRTSSENSRIDPTVETRRNVQMRRKKNQSKNLVLLVTLSVVAVVLVTALIVVLVTQNS